MLMTVKRQVQSVTYISKFENKCLFETKFIRISSPSDILKDIMSIHASPNMPRQRDITTCACLKNYKVSNANYEKCGLSIK